MNFKTLILERNQDWKHHVRPFRETTFRGGGGTNCHITLHIYHTPASCSDDAGGTLDGTQCSSGLPTPQRVEQGGEEETEER